MENNKLVSIIMPSYNTGKFIKESIESVLEQSYSNWELIIVDDCSSDNTDDIVAPYLVDSRIHYIKNEKNSGAAVSRNRALREAKGKWITFLDSDDLWHPQKLEKQIMFMVENDYKFTYTDYRIQLNGKWLPYVYTGPMVVNKRKMKDYCYFSTITVMYEREYVGLVQIEPVRKNNDYAMWLKVCKKADAYLLDEPLAKYRRGRIGSISSHGYITLIKWHYKLFRESEQLGVVASAFITLVNLVCGVFKKIKYVKSY